MVSAIGKELLFPYRDFSLHALHGIGTGFKSGVTVGGGHRDDDAALANLEPTNAMHHGNLTDGKFLLHLGTNLGQLFFCHRGIGFVLQILDWAAIKIVAHNTIEGHHGTVAGTLDEVIELLHAQRFCRDFKHQTPPLTGGISASSSPSAKGVSGSTKSICTAQRVL